MFAVTLKQLRENEACFSGYNKVVRALQEKPFTSEDKERKSYLKYKHSLCIPLVDILESNGLDDALWSMCCLVDRGRDLILFAVWCVRQVQHLMIDNRSITALAVVEAYANGQATYIELQEATSASYAAAYAAASAASVTAAAASAAYAVTAAAYAADDAVRAATAVTATAVTATAYTAQKEMFILMCQGKAPWQISERK